MIPSVAASERGRGQTRTCSGVVGPRDETLTIRRTALKGRPDVYKRQMQFLLPIFSSLPVLRFIDEKRGFFDQLAIRYKSSFKFYIKTILKYALIAAATCFAGYMIYYIVGVVRCV